MHRLDRRMLLFRNEALAGHVDRGSSLQPGGRFAVRVCNIQSFHALHGDSISWTSR